MRRLPCLCAPHPMIHIQATEPTNRVFLYLGLASRIRAKSKEHESKIRLCARIAEPKSLSVVSIRLSPCSGLIDYRRSEAQETKLSIGQTYIHTLVRYRRWALGMAAPRKVQRPRRQRRIVLRHYLNMPSLVESQVEEPGDTGTAFSI